MWKVMIADDEVYMLEAMEKLIDWKKMNCNLVFKAQNGQELIEQIKLQTPDIIITDIVMPLVNGIEIARYVYEHNLSTKVIILSAYAEFEYAQEAIAYDVCGYIVKTSVIETLPATILKAIHQLSTEKNYSETFTSNHSDDILEKLQKYISLHYTEPLTLTKISKHVHANGSYLSRLYKEKTGQNLFYAINKMKLEKAKEYILQGLKIYEAAHLAGFDDVSYFSRIFKKFEGCTPTEYEKKIHEKT